MDIPRTWGRSRRVAPTTGVLVSSHISCQHQTLPVVAKTINYPQRSAATVMALRSEPVDFLLTVYNGGDGCCPQPAKVAQAHPNPRDPLVHRRPLLAFTCCHLACHRAAGAGLGVGHRGRRTCSRRRHLQPRPAPRSRSRSPTAPLPARNFRLAGGDNLTLPLASSGRLTLQRKRRAGLHAESRYGLRAV